LFHPRDILFYAGLEFSGGLLAFGLVWTRRQGRRLSQPVTGDIVKKSATQFLWSCVFFAMISGMFGLAVAGFVWLAPSFLRTFGFYFYGGLTCVAIYPVRRDAKRLAGAASDLG
jgi:hypothetical protein